MRGGRSPAKSVFDDVDQWLDRLQLVDEGDDEVASFLDTLDLRGPQEREMLTELTRKTPLARPEAFPAAHQSRKFAVIAIVLTTLAWVVMPAAIAVAVLA
jgi:hypothetical protein